MSQVRGRIKTVVKYNDQLNTVGTCCGSDGTKTEKSFSQCSAEGGRWVPVLPIEDVECPNVSDRGCCCSCAYTTKNTGTPDDWTHPDHREDLVFRKRGSPDGLRDNISRCECSYYEGNWNEGECPSSEQEIRDFCYLDPDVGVEGRDDVRWPFACCHCKYDANDEVYRECSSVCLSRDCAALGEGFEQTGFNCIPEFDPFKICDYEFNGQPKECPEVEDAVFGCTNPACDNYDPNADYDDGSCSGCDDGGGGTGPEEPTGACCQGTQCTDNLTAAQCAGIGGAFQGVNVSCVSDPCNSSPPPPPPPNPPGTILGCTDPAATNYNEDATVDDGSCEYSPPPPPTTCSNGGSTYTIAVDVSGRNWVNGYDGSNTPVDTVFRPTDNDGSETDQGPKIYQTAGHIYASGGGLYYPDDDFEPCESGCGVYCPGVGGSLPFKAWAWDSGFGQPRRTLGLGKSNTCVQICDDGPGPEGSDQQIEWEFATKKLVLPSTFLQTIGQTGVTGEIYSNNQPTGEIGVKWGCKRRINSYRCLKEGFDPYIKAEYVSEYRDVELENPDDPDSPRVFTRETLDAYMDFRPESEIEALWDEYFATGSSRSGEDVTYEEATSEFGSLFVSIINFDEENYDPFNLPVFNRELYKEELIRQFDFHTIDANLSFMVDYANTEFGDPGGSLIYDASRTDCADDPENDPNQDEGFRSILEILCNANPDNATTFSMFNVYKRHKLTPVDPVGGPVLPKTKRCYDVCMEADTPINLREYPDIGNVFEMIPTWRQWGFGYWGAYGNCDSPGLIFNDPFYTLYPDYNVYARNYGQAKQQCEDINASVIQGPTQWPPQRVSDFYYISQQGFIGPWSKCLNYQEICSSLDIDDLFNSCFNHYFWGDGALNFMAVGLPTASLASENYLPGSLYQQNNSYAAWNGLYNWRKFINSDPAQCDLDGSDNQKAANCVFNGFFGEWCDGGERYSSENFWKLPSGYLYNDGPAGACLNSTYAGYNFTIFYTEECLRDGYYGFCCSICTTCFAPGSEKFRRPPHPNRPEQPPTPFLFTRETINQGKYIDPRQAGIEIPKSQDASACCVANYEGDKFTCSYMTRKDCEMQNGFFNIPDEDGPITCSKTICPALPTRSKSGFVTPPSIKASDLPEPGKLFAGGVYIGTFKPGISQVLTSVETGSTGRLKTCSADGPGDKRSWAIILAPTDLGAEFGLDSMMYRYITASEKIPQTQTSLFDGLYNTYGNDKSVRQAKTSLMKQIKNYNLYGFKDWYLPSVEELGFVGAQQRDLDFGVNLGRYSQNQSKLGSDTPYMTSSRKISKKKPSKSLTRDFTSYPSANLVYGVLVGNSLGPMNGFTILSGLDNTFRVRLARRIYVED